MQSIFRVSYLLILLAFLGSIIFAQSSIANVPSTDVQSKKTVYFEGNFIAHFDKLNNGGFQTYGYKLLYGVNNRLEVGTNFFYTRSGSPSAKELQGNAKVKIYENKKHGFAVAAGTQVVVPLKDKNGAKTYSVFYTNASKFVPKTNGMRITGGIYVVFGGNSDFGTKKGAKIGIEQPILNRVSFFADWISGKNPLGYSSAGFSIDAGKNQTIYVGYNFGNSGRGNNSFSFAYGFTY